MFVVFSRACYCEGVRRRKRKGNCIGWKFVTLPLVESWEEIVGLFGSSACERSAATPVARFLLGLFYTAGRWQSTRRCQTVHQVAMMVQ
ncbi:unnamed protein product [Calypogeia fissa]